MILTCYIFNLIKYSQVIVSENVFLSQSDKIMWSKIFFSHYTGNPMLSTYITAHIAIDKTEKLHTIWSLHIVHCRRSNTVCYSIYFTTDGDHFKEESFNKSGFYTVKKLILEVVNKTFFNFKISLLIQHVTCCFFVIVKCTRNARVFFSVCWQGEQGLIDLSPFAPVVNDQTLTIAF